MLLSMCGFSNKCDFSNNCDWKGPGYIVNFKLTVRKPGYKDSTLEVCIPMKELESDDFTPRSIPGREMSNFL